MLNHSGLMTTKESTKRQESTKKRIHQRTIKLAAVFCLDFDNECHAYDIVDIFSANAKAKRIHDFLVELMKEFAPILAGDLALRKQLFDYLYTLEDGDNSVNAQQEFQNDTGIQYSPRQILIIDDVGQTLQEAADNNFSACTPMEVVNFMEDRQITIGGNLIENGIYQEN